MIPKREILIAMPAYNEGRAIGSVIKELKSKGFSNILVVDDGSIDNTVQVAQKAGAQVLVHPINRGAGAATATCLEYAKRTNFKYIVLIDSDGQHSPKDIEKLLKQASKYDVVIGSRMMNPKGMPFSRKFLNFGGSLATWFIFGLFVRDSQSGFKVFNRKAIEKIRITYDRYEFCSEVIGEIKRNRLTHIEVPIKVIYTDHSLSKGQSFKNGVKMLFRFVFRV